MTKNKISLALLALGFSSSIAAQQSVNEASEASEASKASEPIEAIEVKGRATQFYFYQESAMATKTLTDYMDLPQSLQVLTQELLQDQAARQTSDVYRSISGMTQFSYSGVNARGFRQDQVRYDGVQGDPYGGFSIPQLFNIERIEVLKGPSGMLYGGGQPGGLLNYVTKKPKFETQGEVGLFAGNYNLKGAFADLTGSVNGSDTLAYRVSGFHQSVEPFRNNTDESNTLLSLGMTWLPTENSEIIFQYDHIDQDLGGHRLRGVPVDDDGNFLTDISYNPNEETDFQRVKADIFQTIINTDISENLSNTTVLRYLTNERSQNYHENRGLLEDNRTMVREFRSQFRTNDEFSLTTDFIYNASIAGMKHTLLMGGDYFVTDAEFANTAGRGEPSLIPNIDIINPVYGADSSTYLTRNFPLRETGNTRAGVYLQDQIELNEQWQAIVGLRYDHFEEENKADPDNLNYSDSDISPRFGVVYKPSEDVSVFASRSSGFNPQSLFSILDDDLDDDSPDRLEPEESEQWELGLKNKWLNGALLTTLTLYEIVKDNVTVGNPEDMGINDGQPSVLQIGEVTSRGMEFDVVGDFAENWTGTFNYAYNDAKVTGGLPRSIGNTSGDEFVNAPDHTLGLWTRYAIPSIDSAVAIGMDYVSERISFSGQTVKSYVVWDASWRTTYKTFDIQLNIRNLLNKEYASSGFNQRNGHFPGEPRAVLLQVSNKF
jgi:iron complex outermembrane receptor protein